MGQAAGASSAPNHDSAAAAGPSKRRARGPAEGGGGGGGLEPPLPDCPVGAEPSGSIVQCYFWGFIKLRKGKGCDRAEDEPGLEPVRFQMRGTREHEAYLLPRVFAVLRKSKRSFPINQ